MNLIHFIRIRRGLSAIIAIAVAAGCQGNSSVHENDLKIADQDRTVALAVPDDGYQIASEPFVVKAGEEVQVCDIVRVEPKNGEHMVWLNGFESLTSKGTHHMNVFAGRFSVGDTIADGFAESLLGHDLGQYDCEELGDLMEAQGAQVFYPSQRSEQRGYFPPGVGYPVALPLVLIMNHHYINTTDEDILVNARVNMVATDPEDVEHVAGFIWGRDGEIELPPTSRKIEGGTCVFEDSVNMIAISSHTHERGDCFTMNMYDGETSSVAEEPFFVNTDWESPPILFFDKQDWTGNQTVVMNKGDGISFGCHYENDSDRTVTDGPSAEDEMCIFVALVYPARIAVTEVEQLMAEPSLDNFDKFQQGTMLPCRFEPDPTPWPQQNEVLPLTEPTPAICDSQPVY